MTTTSPELTDLPAQRVVGVQVEAPFDELRHRVPMAWQALLGRAAELPGPGGTGYVEASQHLGGGRYRETVGVLTGADTPVPAGMAAVVLPAGRWARLVHDGPLAQIADGFGRLHDWCTAQGLPSGDLKLDTGYTADGSGPHLLHVDVPGAPG
ncbi:GyrI-like domain-containing protein [Modestobacter lacusdianchii]